jgi:hypothetical protein
VEGELESKVAGNAQGLSVSDEGARKRDFESRSLGPG